MGREAKGNPFSSEHQVPASRDGVIDLRGRKLEVGDEIVLNLQGPIFFRVVDIGPVLDPKAPPNMLKIEVAAALNWMAVRGQLNLEFLRVRTAEEAGPMNVAKIEPPPVVSE